MRTRSSAIATVAAIAAVAAAIPAAASAAQIQVDQAYYQDSTGTVALTGNGFDPSQAYQVALDGKQLKGSGTTEPDGSVAGSIATPQLARNSAHTYTLTVTEGQNTATTTFAVTPFMADFTPGSGNPKTLHVRFKVFGFGLVDSDPLVYLHYVRPNGKLKRTISLGRAKGVCGQIPRTARKKLFPFKTQRGTWELQFDTHKAYHRGHGGVNFLYYRIGVTIRKVFG
jgi:hypothetical protein